METEILCFLAVYSLHLLWKITVNLSIIALVLLLPLTINRAMSNINFILKIIVFLLLGCRYRTGTQFGSVSLEKEIMTTPMLLHMYECVPVRCFPRAITFVFFVSFQHPIFRSRLLRALWTQEYIKSGYGLLTFAQSDCTRTLRD